MSNPEDFIYPAGVRTPLALTEKGLSNAGREVYNLHVISVNLSRIYRYSACSNITVLDHSMALSMYYDWFPRLSLVALLHDASEAFLGDISLPMKKFMKDDYKKMHKACQAKIEQLMIPFELDYHDTGVVHEIDKASVVAEIEHERGLNIPYPVEGRMKGNFAALDYQRVAKKEGFYDRSYTPSEFSIRYYQLLHRVNDGIEAVSK